jgi:multidrug efflux pump subunit AcrA (membrane-fusion protein)
MRFPAKIKLILLITLLLAIAGAVMSCGGSKANVRKEEVSSTPKTVEVTTAAAISRELPSFFEATGSLAGDEQTDVAPQTAGKVVEVGVDIGSAVRRGQMIVRLDDSELKLRVAQSQAQVEQAKAAVRQAEEKIGLRSGQAFDPSRVAEVAGCEGQSGSR